MGIYELFKYNRGIFHLLVRRQFSIYIIINYTITNHFVSLLSNIDSSISNYYTFVDEPCKANTFLNNKYKLYLILISLHWERFFIFIFFQLSFLFSLQLCKILN